MINEEDLKKLIDRKYEDENRLLSELGRHGVAFQSDSFSEEQSSLLKNLESDQTIYWGESGDVAIAKTTVPGLLVVKGDYIESPYYIPTTKEAKIAINDLKSSFLGLERLFHQYGAKTQ